MKKLCLWGICLLSCGVSPDLFAKDKKQKELAELTKEWREAYIVSDVSRAKWTVLWRTLANPSITQEKFAQTKKELEDATAALNSHHLHLDKLDSRAAKLQRSFGTQDSEEAEALGLMMEKIESESEYLWEQISTFKDHYSPLTRGIQNSFAIENINNALKELLVNMRGETCELIEQCKNNGAVSELPRQIQNILDSLGRETTQGGGVK